MTNLPFSISDAPQFDYVNPEDPSVSINPKKLYATWLNLVSGELFICIDRSTGANVWVRQQSDTPQGNGVYLNGTTSYIDLGAARLPTTDEFWTLEIDYAYISQSTTYSYPLSQYTTGQSGRTAFSHNNSTGNLEFYISWAGTMIVGTTTTTRQTVAFNSDGANYRGYVNGVYVLTDSPTSGLLNQNTLIGAGYDSDGSTLINFCEMNIYALRIYGSKLEGSELLSVYNNGGITYPNPILKYHWTFHEGSGTTSTDHESGAVATLSNCTWL